MSYRHQPLRRILVSKGQGKTRPIGISCLEDKIVQGALCEILEALYEPSFRGCSHGFRPGRKAHDALQTLNRVARSGKVSVILESDVQSFFDDVDRPMLREMLQERIADKSFMRLIGKCLKVGVLEGEEFSRPEVGTAQGSIVSPILGNIYLHNVLDVWFEDVSRMVETSTSGSGEGPGWETGWGYSTPGFYKTPAPTRSEAQ